MIVHHRLLLVCKFPSGHPSSHAPKAPERRSTMTQHERDFFQIPAHLAKRGSRRRGHRRPGLYSPSKLYARGYRKTRTGTLSACELKHPSRPFSRPPYLRRYKCLTRPRLDDASSEYKELRPHCRRSRCILGRFRSLDAVQFATRDTGFIGGRSTHRAAARRLAPGPQ